MIGEIVDLGTEVKMGKERIFKAGVDRKTRNGRGDFGDFLIGSGNKNVGADFGLSDGILLT